jgi:acetyl-CoA carboxylase carboxyl transferase subunit beta
MTWFKRSSSGPKAKASPRDLPDGVWVKCDSCSEILYFKELERNLHVCPKCGHHFRIRASRYIEILVDAGTFRETERHLTSLDPLQFKDSKKYSDRLKAAVAKTGMNEAVLTGRGSIDGRDVVLGIMDFAFIGGSMASAVGEKIARAMRLSLETRAPLILVSASGGARMMEGILSLMQMAKTGVLLARLMEARIPYISVLTNPTPGGVTASFASLGDVILADPGALIGFAGPRVIRETVSQELPPGFQRAEFLLEHGFVDCITPRHELRPTIGRLLSVFGDGLGALGTAAYADRRAGAAPRPAARPRADSGNGSVRSLNRPAPDGPEGTIPT